MAAGGPAYGTGEAAAVIAANDAQQTAMLWRTVAVAMQSTTDELTSFLLVVPSQLCTHIVTCCQICPIVDKEHCGLGVAHGCCLMEGRVGNHSRSAVNRRPALDQSRKNVHPVAAGGQVCGGAALLRA